MVKKIIITIVSINAIFLFFLSEGYARTEYSNPNVDWRIVQKSPQKFNNWMITFKYGTVCKDYKSNVCTISEILKKDEKVTVLGQVRDPKESYLQYYKIKTGSGNIGYIYKNEVYLPLNNPNNYKITANGSLIRVINLSKLKNVKMTNTINKSRKENELLRLAKSTNMSYYDGEIHLIDINYTRYDSDSCSISFEFDKSGVTFGFQNYVMPDSLYNKNQKSLKIILEALLRPYYPKSYKKLTEIYINSDYDKAKKIWKLSKNKLDYIIDGRPTRLMG